MSNIPSLVPSAGNVADEFVYDQASGTVVLTMCQLQPNILYSRSYFRQEA